MTKIIIMPASRFTFDAKLETEKAPLTCAAFLEAMPFVSKIMHVKWSGECAWIPLGDMDFGIGYENATSHPAPGQIILYPGGMSETEIMLAYGAASFVSKVGPLAGNHFMTLTSSLENLFTMGDATMREGAFDVRFEVLLDRL